MSSDDNLIKKIQKAVKDEIRPVKELTEILKKKIDSTEFLHKANRESVRTIKDQQSVINEKLDEIKASIDDSKTGLVAINRRLDDPKTGLGRMNERLDAIFEQTTELTEDMYGVKQTQSVHTKVLKNVGTNLEHQVENTGKLNKRVRTLENHAGIVPPPELTLTD